MSGHKKKPSGVIFKRTRFGQMVYDVLISRLSAVEVVRRHPTLSLDFVYSIRKANPKLRKSAKGRR